MFCDEHGTADYCPTCTEIESNKRIEKLEAELANLKTLTQAVVDSGSMCMDLQVVSMPAFNALAAALEEK